MSGHSKWSQIKHKKALADSKKGKVFGKLAQAISIAARANPDPSKNLRLKGEIERARAVNMPNESIERAIRRTTDKDAAALSEIQVELIGPASAAIIVSAITDNSNRTINDLKKLAATFDAHMAGQGAVSWMFKKTGIIELPAASSEEVQLMAIDAGADDVAVASDSVLVYTSPEAFQRVKDALGASVVSSRLELISSTPLEIPDEHEKEKLIGLLEAIDELDDVQDVVTNANLS
jgi:YebC/PmpR family DNA-binding regulatory protein